MCCFVRQRACPGDRIMRRHCLRNIMPTYISLMAISVPHILGGTYIVETVFSYPGIGTLSYESARYGDYNMLMVLCLLTGAVVIFCNMVGQIMNERIDPRVRGEPGIIMMKRKRDTACGKKKMPVASCIILLVIVLGCVFADVICKKDPSYLDLMNYTKAPNAEFWFGTDTLGRDIFSCIWHGGRVSLLIGVGINGAFYRDCHCYGAISGIAGEKVVRC